MNYQFETYLVNLTFICNKTENKRKKVNFLKFDLRNKKPSVEKIIFYIFLTGKWILFFSWMEFHLLILIELKKKKKKEILTNIMVVAN